jgi:hypothetical protein
LKFHGPDIRIFNLQEREAASIRNYCGCWCPAARGDGIRRQEVNPIMTNFMIVVLSGIARLWRSATANAGVVTIAFVIAIILFVLVALDRLIRGATVQPATD